MSAESRIAQFAAATGPSAFPAISRADVITGLRARVDDPRTVRQGHASLCGPAAFFHCLLQDDPETYAKYVIDLFNSGSANLGTLKIKPSDGCRNYRPEHIEPIDWISLASLRDSENVFLDYSNVKREAAGMTLPMALADWFRAVGYQDVRNETNVFFTKGRSEIDSAYALRLQGRRVCFLVNDDILDADTNTSGGLTTIPTHWIVLTLATGVRGGALTVTVWSWGRVIRIPPTGTLTVDQFCGNFFGYVSGRFPAK